MAVNNSLTAQGSKKLTFSQAIQTEQYQKLINTALRDQKRVNRFVAAVVSAVSANPLLQQCEPSSILSAALQGEALELSPSPTLGEYYLVPYKKSVKNKKTGEWEKIPIAQFQIGTAGRVQLAMRTGQYKDLDAIEIKVGEYRGRHPETGKALFKFVEDEDERENLPTLGYLGYFQLTNGFYHSVFMTTEQCLRWAEKYSKSFDRKLYDKVKSGAKLDWKEEQAASQTWIAHTGEMCKNLVLRRALKNAPKSIEMRNIVEGDEKTEADIASAFKTPAPTDFEQKVTGDFFDGAEVIDEPEVEEKPKTTRKKATPTTTDTEE